MKKNNKPKTAEVREFEISNSDWKIIEQRQLDYKNGTAKMYTREEVRTIILKNLKK